MMKQCNDMMEKMRPEMKKEAMGMMKKCQQMMAGDSEDSTMDGEQVKQKEAAPANKKRCVCKK